MVKYTVALCCLAVFHTLPVSNFLVNSVNIIYIYMPFTCPYFPSQVNWRTKDCQDLSSFDGPKEQTIGTKICD